MCLRCFLLLVCTVMQENNLALTLNSTVQEINGLEFFRDHTGVTVKKIVFGQIFSLFFDGDTAQINIEGRRTEMCHWGHGDG